MPNGRDYYDDFFDDLERYDRFDEDEPDFGGIYNRPQYGRPGPYPGSGPGRVPFQGPGQGPGMRPRQEDDMNQMPPGPPPRSTPTRDSGESRLYAVDPGAIKNCRYRYTYIWLENGRSFWAWLTFVGRQSVAGYRWTRTRFYGYRWVYFGTDLDNISDFECF